MQLSQVNHMAIVGLATAQNCVALWCRGWEFVGCRASAGPACHTPSSAHQQYIIVIIGILATYLVSVCLLLPDSKVMFGQWWV